MKKIKYSIIEDRFEDGLPTYYVLQSTYYFGINLVGRLYGVGGSPNVPFLDIDSAEDFKKLIENE